MSSVKFLSPSWRSSQTLLVGKSSIILDMPVEDRSRFRRVLRKVATRKDGEFGFKNPRFSELDIYLSRVEIYDGSLIALIENRIRAHPLASVLLLGGLYQGIASYPDFKDGFSELKTDLVHVTTMIASEVSIGLEANLISSDFYSRDPEQVFRQLNRYALRPKNQFDWD